jgi:aminomethyltransferase
MTEPKQTPLTDLHRQSGGKLVEFAGFLMPVQFSGVVDEHNTVRNAVGLFDVSHMGEVEFRGPAAVDAVHRLVTNNVATLEDGQALYTPVCYPDGGIVDDCLVYRHAADRVLIVVNASNIAKDYQWFVEQTGQRCEVNNLSDEIGLLALQGPRACETLASVTEADVAALAPFSFTRGARIGGVECDVARTGYTGEDGFEIACTSEATPSLWSCLMEAGQGTGIKPCGLGARDTLRLEARLALYGNDIDASTTPLEAGLGWTVKLKAGEFIGHEALRRQKKEGVRRKLVCLEMRSRGIARHGHAIHEKNDDDSMGPAIGEVTSGTKSPTLGIAIAMGYVPKELSKVGTRVLVDVRGKAVEAEVIKGPFYRRPKQG